MFNGIMLNLWISDTVYPVGIPYRIDPIFSPVIIEHYVVLAIHQRNNTGSQYLVAKIRISEEKAKFYWDFFEREYLRTKFRDRD